MNDHRRLFCDLGMQYYIAGRLSTRAGLVPIPGNLFHHAAEMFLKAALAGTLTLAALKKKSHNLTSLWTAFKDSQPDPSALARHNDTITALDRFESIRYPDNMLLTGFTAQIPFAPSPLPSFTFASAHRLPHYGVAVSDVDLILIAILRTYANPRALAIMLPPAAREALTLENPAATEWHASGVP